MDRLIYVNRGKAEGYRAAEGRSSGYSLWSKHRIQQVSSQFEAIFREDKQIKAAFSTPEEIQRERALSSPDVSLCQHPQAQLGSSRVSLRCVPQNQEHCKG